MARASPVGSAYGARRSAEIAWAGAGKLAKKRQLLRPLRTTGGPGQLALPRSFARLGIATPISRPRESLAARLNCGALASARGADTVPSTAALESGSEASSRPSHGRSAGR